MTPKLQALQLKIKRTWHSYLFQKRDMFMEVKRKIIKRFGTVKVLMALHGRFGDGFLRVWWIH